MGIFKLWDPQKCVIVPILNQNTFWLPQFRSANTCIRCLPFFKQQNHQVLSPFSLLFKSSAIFCSCRFLSCFFIFSGPCIFCFIFFSILFPFHLLSLGIVRLYSNQNYAMHSRSFPESATLSLEEVLQNFSTFLKAHSSFDTSTVSEIGVLAEMVPSKSSRTTALRSVNSLISDSLISVNSWFMEHVAISLP